MDDLLEPHWGTELIDIWTVWVCCDDDEEVWLAADDDDDEEVWLAADDDDDEEVWLADDDDDDEEVWLAKSLCTTPNAFKNFFA